MNIHRNPVIRAVAVLALAIGLFAAAPLSAGAVEACSAIPGNYGDTMQLTAKPPQTTPGSVVVITGTGYPKNCTLTVYVDGTSIGTATTDGNGTFTINWNVPANATLGAHKISTNVSAIEVSANVQVIATSGNGNGSGSGGSGSGSTSSTSLPATGADVLPFLGGGVALLVIGSLLVLATRKRNTGHA